MSKNRLMLMFWFAGISGFFLVLATIFVEMVDNPGHRQVLLYEPSEFVFWAEMILIIIILFITMWILYEYVSGKGVLTIEIRKRR